MKRKSKVFVLFAVSILLLCAITGMATAADSDEADLTCPACTGSITDGAVMHPDRDTIEKWLKAYEEAPAAPVSRVMATEAIAAGRSVSLLPHLDYIAAARSQGSCGNCWVWTGTGIMEIAHDVENGIFDRLSIQYFNSNFGPDYACCGGWLDEFADFYDNKKIAVPWTNTNASWQDWNTNCSTSTNVPANNIGDTPRYCIDSIQERRIITLGGSTATAISNIKAELDNNRGVWLSFFGPDGASRGDFNDFFFNGQATDLFVFDQWDGQRYNDTPGEGWGHAVLIVGYNDTAINPDDDYWLVLNSWGNPANRPDGTFRMSNNINYDAHMTNFGADSGHYLQFMTLDIDFCNSVPEANAGGPYTGTEGTAVAFTAAGTTDPEENPLQYRWDFESDGTYDTAFSTDPTASYIYCDDFSGTATVEVSDGEFTDTATASVTVNNVAPSIASIADITSLDEGTAFMVAGSFSDPGCDQWIAEVDYDDGYGFQPLSLTGKTFTLSQSYCSLGEHQIIVNVSDDDDGSDTEEFGITVVNVPPVADAGEDMSVDEGATATFSGSVEAAGACDILTYEWNFGDDSPKVTGTLTPSHVYGDNGIYTVTLTVTDDEGTTGSDTLSVTVLNVAPTVTKGAMDQPNPQFILPTVHDLTFHATFSDPGWLDTHTALWSFGDSNSDAGTLSEENNPPDATGILTATHTYSAPGDYFVIVTVTDDDGGVNTSDQWTVHISDVTEAKHDLVDYVQNLPEDVFKGKANQRKATFANMFVALDDMIAEEEWNGFITSLQNNIRSKADGEIDGKASDDWITDNEAQDHICMKIDDIVAYVNTFL